MVRVNLLILLPFAAGISSLVLAGAGLLRARRSLASRLFLIGMLALGLESLFTGLAFRASAVAGLVSWLTASYIVKSLVPVVWLAFSLTYSRGNFRERLNRWKVPLLLAGIAPLALVAGVREQLVETMTGDAVNGVTRFPFGVMAKGWNGVLLISFVLVVANVEQTFRAAVGTMRWRVKFVVLALAVIFGAQIYVSSQGILFSGPQLALTAVESGALLVGSLFLAIAYARTGLAEIEVYPSLAVVRSSLTVLLVGAYLFVVGVLAQIVKRFGGAEIFQYQALVVLVGLSGLGLLLLSDRARHRVHVFAARHFRKAQHDSARIWTLFSRQLSDVTDQAGLSTVASRSIAETFDVLSVSLWLADSDTGKLTLSASTALQGNDPASAGSQGVASADVMAGLQDRTAPFDLENVRDAWAGELRRINPSQFPNGGDRWCVPLRTGERVLGVIVLADRISGAVYTLEELELLQCIGEHITSVLVNLRLAGAVAQARELEAFRTMSAFFVHDLKNTAASLNLMLKNLPVHFDDPAFRQDALRGIGNSARRIDGIIGRLAALRQRPELRREPCDLNQVIAEVLDRLTILPGVELARDLQPLPAILADRDQIQSVVANLVLNAQDAVAPRGCVQVRTDDGGASVLMTVSDDGQGMSEEFVKESLFRPFQSTKKNGLGIGLFQARAIVQAHGGGVQVRSEVGKGTTFVVSLPAGAAR